MVMEILYHCNDWRSLPQHRYISIDFGCLLLVCTWIFWYKMHDSSFCIRVSWLHTLPWYLNGICWPIHCVRLPWDQTTPLGYMGEICFVILTGACFMICGSFILLFISLCLHHRTFYTMIQHFVTEFDDLQEKHSENEILCNLIRFHISAKT